MIFYSFRTDFKMLFFRDFEEIWLLLNLILEMLYVQVLLIKVFCYYETMYICSESNRSTERGKGYVRIAKSGLSRKGIS